MTMTEDLADERADDPAGEPAELDGLDRGSPVREGVGLYGNRGWTIRTGMWAALAPYCRVLRSGAEPTPRAPLPADPLGADGAPTQEYTPFDALGPEAARHLLEVLPPAQLEDRQNLAPTLGSLLRACAAANGSLLLSGYGIGPQREDERMSAEAIWVADRDLLAMTVSTTHDASCQCRELWRAVRTRYRLDAQCVPDEVSQRQRDWDSGPLGTWMWWD